MPNVEGALRALLTEQEYRAVQRTRAEVRAREEQGRQSLHVVLTVTEEVLVEEPERTAEILGSLARNLAQRATIEKSQELRNGS